MRKIIGVLLAAVTLSSARAQVAAPGVHDWAKRTGSWVKVNSVDDFMMDIITDKHGNIYIAEQVAGMVNIDGHTAAPDSSAMLVLASWDCNGVFRWMKVMGAVQGSVNSYRLAADTAEGIYLAGSISTKKDTGRIYFDSDTSFTGRMGGNYIIKYNSAGVMQWFRAPYLDTSSAIGNAPVVLGMSVAENGTIYYSNYMEAGMYIGGAITLLSPAYCVLRYDASGSFQNYLTLQMNSTNSAGRGDASIKRDPVNGRFYVTGTYAQSNLGTLTLGNTTIIGTGAVSNTIYMGAFTSSGSSLWVKQGSPDKVGSLCNPVFDKDGNLYLAGIAQAGCVFNGDTVANDSGYTDFMLSFVTAMDTAGNRLWYHSGQGGSITGDLGSPITYANSVVSVTGTYATEVKWDSLLIHMNTSSYAHKVFVLSMDASTGKAIALDSIGGGGFIVSNSMLATDKNSNLYVAGMYSSKLYFGNTILQDIDTSRLTMDGFIAKYKNVNCNCDLLQPEFSAIPSGAFGYTFSYTGQTPYSSIKWDFGDGVVLTSNPSPSHLYAKPGNYPVCVTVSNGCGFNTICHWVNIVSTNVKDIGQQIDGVYLYPNPASNCLTIEKSLPGTITVELYGMQGQRIFRTVLKEKKNELNVSELKTGAYLIRFTEENGRQTSSRFIKQ